MIVAKKSKTLGGLNGPFYFHGMKTTIFLHGALGSAAQFDAILPLVSSSETCAAISLPGHGPEKPKEPYSLELFSEAILRFMDERNIPTARFFGYSMGGYVALYLAARHPDRVSSVHTLGTKLHWTPEVAAGMSRMFDPEKIEAKAPQLAASLSATHADWREVCRFTASFLLDLGHTQAISDLEFSKIKCPVSIGWGTADNVVSQEESEHVASLIKGCQLVILPGVKHQIEQTEPAIIANYVFG